MVKFASISVIAVAAIAASPALANHGASAHDDSDNTTVHHHHHHHKSAEVTHHPIPDINGFLDKEAGFWAPILFDGAWAKKFMSYVSDVAHDVRLKTKNLSEDHNTLAAHGGDKKGDHHDAADHSAGPAAHGDHSAGSAAHGAGGPLTPPGPAPPIVPEVNAPPLPGPAPAPAVAGPPAGPQAPLQPRGLSIDEGLYERSVEELYTREDPYEELMARGMYDEEELYSRSFLEQEELHAREWEVEEVFARDLYDDLYLD